MIYKFSSEKGFTLLETLIAMVILGIGLSILVEAYLIVTDTIIHQRDYNYLLNWSDSKIVEIVNGIELADHGNFEYNGKLFQWKIEEEYDLIVFREEQDLKSINLIINWQGHNGRKSYSISRLILNS